ncbi:MAG: ferrous iron transport protein A [Clostridia bacterium]|nr:ferrous iron transport protein A [Clostridia bacterium]MBP3360102.1 ferrous iron transport protein A [Clostridia bacterium]
MKLSDGTKGSKYRIDKILLDASVTRRFYALGMTQNTELAVLNIKKSGPAIIKVRGTRFAVGRKFCEGIYVRGNGE